MVDCPFTLSHYRDILDAAGDVFEFSTFDRDPGDTRRLYLRHDVDVSLENAVAIAELEAEMGVTSTYFLPINSPYYNLLNDIQIDRVRSISRLGHSIGLHVDERGAYMGGFNDIEAALDSVYEILSDIFPVEKVISFHMPSQYDFTRRDAIGEFVNAYASRFTEGNPVKYLSDSNRRWREGCFYEHLDNLEFDSYQVLLHPVWWHDEPLNGKELFEKVKSTNQEGLEVNLKDDIQLFANF